MKNILIIDDDPSILNFFTEALEKKGFTTKAASSGKEGLACMGEFNPDMVLLDIMMPDMDGWQVLEEMVVRKLCQNTKVVMLTAKPLSEEDTYREEFENLVSYINKPVSLKNLVDQIQEIFREEERIEEEARKLLQSFGKDFAKNYQLFLQSTSRKRRIVTKFLERQESLHLLRDGEMVDHLIFSIAEMRKDLDRVLQFLQSMKEGTN